VAGFSWQEFGFDLISSTRARAVVAGRAIFSSNLKQRKALYIAGIPKAESRWFGAELDDK
jgi:hypothetical protein